MILNIHNSNFVIASLFVKAGVLSDMLLLNQDFIVISFTLTDSKINVIDCNSSEIALNEELQVQIHGLLYPPMCRG